MTLYEEHELRHSPGCRVRLSGSERNRYSVEVISETTTRVLYFASALVAAIVFGRLLADDLSKGLST